jgi:hypothetical protein
MSYPIKIMSDRPTPSELKQCQWAMKYLEPKLGHIGVPGRPCPVEFNKMLANVMPTDMIILTQGPNIIYNILSGRDRDDDIGVRGLKFVKDGDIIKEFRPTPEEFIAIYILLKIKFEIESKI